MGLRAKIAFAWTLPLTVALTCAGAAGVADDAAAHEDVWSAVCSAKIEHPLYTDAAVQSRLTGTVSADITVLNEKASILELDGPPPLADSVRTALLTTTFPTACTGRRLKVKFSFKTASDMPVNYKVSVCCSHPPNQFSILAGPIQMVCSHYSYMAPLTEPGGLIPVTVCELLANRSAYDGKEVALLGRFLNSHFDGFWLSEDHCDSKITSGEYSWPNEVWISYSVSAPTPPSGLLVLDPEALAGKLALVRRTTALRMVEETLFHNDGTVTDEPVRENWAVIFGRIETRQDLRPRRGALAVRGNSQISRQNM
jgi:hypothetical protein